MTFEASMALTVGQVFPNTPNSDTKWIELDWKFPIQFFVGRNGSGKSRTAKALVANSESAGISTRLLSTDRLSGWMNFTTFSGIAVPSEYRGGVTSEDEQERVIRYSKSEGLASDALIVLKENPDIALRISALMRSAFGKKLSIVERSGFIDPDIKDDFGSYSLLRDEGHGLRELVILLVGIYRQDWSLLVLDEPELHLHPAMTRILMGELEKECSESGRKAIVVTHEPRLLNPRTLDDMQAIWVFQPNGTPSRLGENLLNDSLHRPAEKRVSESLKQYPNLVSELVFSPRPVLVEGPGDVAALNATLNRLASPIVTSQTDFIPCGGSDVVPMWLDVATHAGLNVRTIADLDSLFNDRFRRVMDNRPGMKKDLGRLLFASPPTNHEALKPLTQAAGTEGAKTEKTKSAWLAGLSAGEPGGYFHRRDQILSIWKTAGVYLHPQGRVEDALELSDHADPRTLAERAHQHDGLQAAALWSAFQTNTDGDEFYLLGLEVERIATHILREEKITPEGSATTYSYLAPEDKKIVDVMKLGSRFRLTVKRPTRWAGYWIEVDRGMALDNYTLQKPVKEAE
ncbi:ATP-dependent nuclease [Streptomyces sp. NPDC086091]|uniref:ATP-dependent nuclease n=1 Tax=Streptomyces sp. NPDC086091 TaxID=3365751 RepID=UPI00382E8767